MHKKKKKCVCLPLFYLYMVYRVRAFALTLLPCKDIREVVATLCFPHRRLEPLSVGSGDDAELGQDALCARDIPGLLVQTYARNRAKNKQLRVFFE